MKRLLLLGALVLVMASCTRDPKGEFSDDKGDGNTGSTDIFTQLTADQSRIIRYQGGAKSYGLTRAVTRANEDAQHPLMAEPDITGIPEYNESQIWNEIAMVVKTTTSATVINTGNLKKIYIAKPNVELIVGDQLEELYVLSTATNVDLRNYYWKDGGIQVKKNCKYYVWGSLFSAPLNPETNSKFYYYGTDELEISISQNAPNAGDDLYMEFHGPVKFTGNTKLTYGTYWFGGETVFEGEFSVDNSYPYMTFAGPVTFKKQASMRYGRYTFEEYVYIEYLFIDNGWTDQPTEFIFNDCAYLNKYYVKGNNQNSLHFYINYYLEFKDGIEFENGSHGVYHLNNSVITICGNADKDLAGHNVFVNGHFVYGEGNSAVFIQGSITGVRPSEQEHVFQYFKTAEGEGNTLAVFGKRYKNDAGELVTEEPVIYVGWASNADSYVNDGYNTVFTDGDVVIKPSELDDDFVIDSKDPNDCRANYTWGEQPPTQDEILPPAKHKYSATGLAFDGNYVYICWHSNLPGGESQDDVDGEEFDHDHGTNMDPDREDEDGYGGPSVDNDEDWGGIIDIVQIDNYHPDNANLYIASTYWQPEHKYNHVAYYDGKLYLASTSLLVGAALHVVPLMDSDEGVGQKVDAANAYRVNLTGKSANCVEIIDQNIVTISGRTEGGLNWFALDDVSTQTKKYKNESTQNYGGKFVYDDGQHVYALHNTDNATVTQYDRKGDKIREVQTGKALVPYDGKNAMLVKDGIVYVCCGRGGLYAFDWASGQKVGQSKMSANCVDVDSNGYIYVATGGGVAVFNKDLKDNDSKEYNTINYVAYTGKGFVYPNGWEEDGTMPDNVAKQSSNFIRVKGDKVFVAYGMYGLRIYTVSELTKAGK